MRWPIVKLIARRELSDLFRDRRTLLMILGLPIVLYPVFGIVGFVFARSLLQQQTSIGIAGAEYLPPLRYYPEAMVLGGAGFTEIDRKIADPALIEDGKFVGQYATSMTDVGSIVIVNLPTDDTGPVDRREVDAMLIVAPDFMTRWKQGQRPTVTVLGREGDEASKVAVKRLSNILGRWQDRLREVKLARAGLPADFDEPLDIINPLENQTLQAKTAIEMRDIFVKVFPFLLVMWTLAGALHPAIDLTAGEKERGTMETLLISPAERLEIVGGKFCAVALFALITAVWNLLFMGGGAAVLSQLLPYPVISFTGLAWAVLFAVPMAALFAGIGLGLGVFARSSKEGQYYLIPLFLFTMPLTLWSLTPGLKLSIPFSFIPVTGMMLVLQRLMAINGEPIPGWCWVGVVTSLVGSITLSLWWAAFQFRRENVLFREAEQFTLGTLIKGLFRRGPRQVVSHEPRTE